jgi:hypothetical protein
MAGTTALSRRQSRERSKPDAALTGGPEIGLNLLSLYQRDKAVNPAIYNDNNRVVSAWST